MPVVLSGPFFERREAAMREICDQIEEDVADTGFKFALQNLIGSIRRPTPYYWTRGVVRKNPAGPGLSVFDNWVIYGPWLEGNGSRNATTRFKGYASYRRAAQALERVAGGIAGIAISKKIGRLN